MTEYNFKSLAERAKDTVVTGAYDRHLINYKLVADQGWHAHSEEVNNEHTYLFPLKSEIYYKKERLKSLKETVDKNREQIDKLEKRKEIIKKDPSYLTMCNFKEQLQNGKEVGKQLMKVSDKTYKEMLANVENTKMLNEEIEECIGEIPYLEELIVKLEKRIPHVELKVYKLNSKDSQINDALRNYKKSKDFEIFRKEMHYIYDLYDKDAFGKDYVAPYKGHLLSYERSPFTREETDRLNKAAVFDWFADW